MKQFTTPEQTAKLIELGFEKPETAILHSKTVARADSFGWNGDYERCNNYSIGELIEMLPATITSIRGRDVFLQIEYYNEWRVRYGCRPDLLQITDVELVDALYRMIFMLKEYKFL